MLKKVLESEEFSKDKTAFNLVSLIVTSVTLEYYTDGENYLICRSSEESPIWVWKEEELL